MTRIFACADRYLKSCSWREIALLKVCLCAVGVLIGVALPPRRKKTAAWMAALAFATTYVPLMAGFLPFLTRGRVEDIYE